MAHGITGCTGVTVVVVASEKLDEAERSMLLHVASKYEQHASEVFASSSSQADDEQMIREAIEKLFTGHTIPCRERDDVAEYQRMREAWASQHRVRNPIASNSDRPADTRSPRERYLASLPPFRSNQEPNNS